MYVCMYVCRVRICTILKLNMTLKLTFIIGSIDYPKYLRIARLLIVGSFDLYFIIYDT